MLDYLWALASETESESQKAVALVVPTGLLLVRWMELKKVRMLGKILKLDHSSGSVGHYQKLKRSFSTLVRTFCEISFGFGS